MLIYFKSGIRNFVCDSVPINKRSAWEFYVSLSGRIGPDLGSSAPPAMREQVLWVFPREHAHGWLGEKTVDRLVFHFTAVPGELEKMIPSPGYYQTPLSDDDCERLLALAGQAAEIMEQPTRLVFLQTQALVSELSLMALRQVIHPALASRQIARNKTEQALGWYSEHMDESPTFKDVAQATFVSSTHLRRLFHWSRGESPHQAMNRIRMQRAEDLLKGTDLSLDAIAARVGLSNGSALSRAVKAHFGITPRNLRRGKRPVRLIK
ncbi:MAG: AraC family transcriptional regulator [Lentisphaeria bacterium]|nr:AraC family transcriptional regulator [Lentisphaeria bacterium]